MNLFQKILPRRQTPSDRKKAAFCCVIDSNPKFVHQAARLLLSIRWHGEELSNSDFYLVSTRVLTGQEKSFFLRHGAFVRRCDPFYEDSPHETANKIRGLEVGDLSGYETTILIDCDTIVCRGFSDFLDMSGVAIKLADLDTVTDDQLGALFKTLGLEPPKEKSKFDVIDKSTFGYFNSGVVIVNENWRERFCAQWSEYCHTTHQCAEEFGIPQHFVEQSALAATVAKLGVPLKVLPASLNLPAHFDSQMYPDWYHDLDPCIVHYHWMSTGDGFISELPLFAADRRAKIFNSRLRSELRRSSFSINSERSASEISVSAQHRPKVVVGTGWWCGLRPHEWAAGLGADETRSVPFFHLWYRQVSKYLDPHKIIVTDSHSPLKPDWSRYSNVEWVVLDANYGGPNDVRVGKVKTHLSGFTKSVINGAMYACCCDADYYVYVEQDCLIRGDNFLAHATMDSSADIFLGPKTENGKGIEGRPAAPMVQQSLIIVRKDGLPRFMNQTMTAEETDGELSPEIKMERDLVPYDFVKVPFGRSRPIDFELSHFYAQHLQVDELEEFMRAEHLGEEFFARMNNLLLLA